MKKEELIEFIKDLGFNQTWTTKPNLYSMPTDMAGKPNQAYVDQLNISIDNEKDMFSLSLTQMSSHMASGKNFGYFSLETFGDKNDLQLEIFLSFILGLFNKKPIHIIQYMRDKKIRDILK